MLAARKLPRNIKALGRELLPKARRRVAIYGRMIPAGTEAKEARLAPPVHTFLPLKTNGRAARTGATGRFFRDLR